MIDYETIDWDARTKLWEKYFKPDTNGWGREKESPVRGVAVCERCSALVDDTWKHMEWHTNLEGEDWER